MPKIRYILTFISIIATFESSYANQESTQKQQQPKAVTIKTQQEINETIDNASIDAVKNAQDAQESITKTSKIVINNNSKQLNDLVENKTKIEKSRKEIAKLQLSLASDLKKTNDDLDNISNAVKKIEDQYSQKYLSKYDLKNLYQEVMTYWRTLADNSLKVFGQKSTFDIQKHDPSNINYKAPKDIEEAEVRDLAKQYEKAYDLLQNEYKNILILKRDLKIANKNQQSDLLLKSGKLRADILQRILSIDKNFITYNNQYFQDLARELKLIPYQPLFLFYSKIQQYRQIIDSGFSGFIYVSKQIGLFILLIITILISRKTLTKLTNFFNLLTQFTIKKSIIDKSYIKPAIIISKITPYFKWLVLTLIFSFINIIIDSTIFSELGFAIPYFQYYFLYQIFRIFVHNSLTDIVYAAIDNGAKHGNNSLNQKIKKTTKTLGFYLFGAIYTMHLTQSIVDKGYFYDLALHIFVIGLVIIFAIITSNWREEIRVISKNKLSRRASRIINKLLAKKRGSVLFSLPIVSILMTRELFYKTTRILGNYDFFKNILSQIYRKKLESAAKLVQQDDDSSINDSYINSFTKNSKSDIFIPIKNHPNEELQSIMKNWLSCKSEENSIAIHSEKGIGKTKFLEKIITDHKNIDILQTSFSKKITDKSDLVKIISDLFGKKIGEKSLFKFLSNSNKKTIIILDDCHNLFLAKEGGFSALNLLFDMLVKINNPNLLWIATFNSYSWNYLNHCLKIKNYFRYVLRLPRWSDENIRELILYKHQKTSFKLIYDPLIFAINTHNTEKEFEDMQQKFFQIIWSQSRGNPTIAMFLWISSLKKEGANSIKISLPKLAKSHQLNKLPDEHLFIYSAIVKHQNLSIDEISNILSITPEEAINTIRIGLEKGYLVEEMKSDKRRYTTSCEWQTAINQLLTTRNFVYAE